MASSASSRSSAGRNRHFPGGNMNKLQQFLRQEEGAAAIEYGLLAGLIAVAIVTTVGLIGTRLNTVFGYVSTALIAITGP